ncbi:MAG TPA: cation transporting ATPase C-terminal domain-containing protein, partial [Nocardioidaceae bacterium]|nr:cation transporting ATPase C-terminal domain-containing protein [Nocardioidaceae bacterium]
GAWWLFEHELSLGVSVEASRTAAVNLFVTVEAFYLFSCRSLTEPVWRTGFFTNRWLLVGVTVQALAQMAFTYLPAMNHLFETAPIGWEAWLRILLAASAIALVVAVDKARLRSRAL